jgi:hypothetical protein
VNKNLKVFLISLFASLIPIIILTIILLNVSNIWRVYNASNEDTIIKIEEIYGFILLLSTIFFFIKKKRTVGFGLLSSIFIGVIITCLYIFSQA